MTFSWQPVIAAGFSLFLAACDSSHQRADLVYNNAHEPETVDPALTTGQPGIRLASSLFEGLTRFNKDGQTEPGMAERWEVSGDGLTYTFHLRETAAWSNGEPFVANDFVQSWRRTLKPETGSKYVSQLFYIKNARAFSEGRLSNPDEIGFRAIGDHVLEVVLENPTPFFVDLCAFVTLSPIHLPSVEKFGDLWTRPANLVCNGPYRISEWRLNHRIRLEKNANYWDQEKVALETIDVLPISDPNSAFNFFYSGMVDLATDKALVPTSLIGALRDKPYFHSGNFLATYFIRFNVTRKPFDDPRIRQAFALAIDKERITRITGMGERPAHSMVPPGTGRDYQPPTEGLRFNIERARALMADAGFPGGKGFPTVDFLYVSQGYEQKIAVELQEMWQTNLGVQVALPNQEWKVYLNSMSELDYDFCRSTWIGDYNDPNTFLDMFVSGSGNNRMGWSNAAYDDLINRAAVETDPVKRAATLLEAEEILIQTETPIVPLYYFVGVQFYHPERLGGVASNVLDQHPFREMFWKSKKPTP